MSHGVPKETRSAYEAHGAALATWQFVETSLYFAVHAALKTEERLSSTVFFHLRSPSAKAKLASELMEQVLPSAVVEQSWKPLSKRLGKATESRNHLAHFEMMAIVYQSGDGPLRIEQTLAEPFHDIKTHQKKSVISYDRTSLEKVATEYRSLASDLLAFVEGHFGPQTLPQELVRQGRERAKLLRNKKLKTKE